MTKQEALRVITEIIYRAIKESGKNGVPAGHLYAMLMGEMDLESFRDIIETLKQSGKVKESNYLLTSIIKT